MRRIICIILIILLAGCSNTPSANSVQTAIAQTQSMQLSLTSSSMPSQLATSIPIAITTLTATVTPIATNTPTIINTPTKTNSPKPTNTSFPTLAPTIGVGSMIISPKDGMVLVYVPMGEFDMGTEDGFGSEKPIHTVYLDAFWIDQMEVTNRQYTLCVAEGDCERPKLLSSLSRSTYYGDSRYDDYPVIYVSWNDAEDYCTWAGRRLPTEAEWEKAALGNTPLSGSHKTSPWGGELSCAFANIGLCVGDTTPVGSYPYGASPYGALDMVGNVDEWVSDWFSPDYYTLSPSDNPQGPESGEERVFRGGNFYIATIDGALRFYMDPTWNPTSYIGFRCAFTP